MVFGEGSTGAADDLAGATELATRMVREFGLSTKLGPVGYADREVHYLPDQAAVSRPYSEATQQLIDREVADLVRRAERTAVDLLTTHRAALDRLTALLLEHETVDGEQVLVTVREPHPTGA